MGVVGCSVAPPPQDAALLPLAGVDIFQQALANGCWAADTRLHLQSCMRARTDGAEGEREEEERRGGGGEQEEKQIKDGRKCRKQRGEGVNG